VAEPSCENLDRLLWGSPEQNSPSLDELLDDLLDDPVEEVEDSNTSEKDDRDQAAEDADGEGWKSQDEPKGAGEEEDEDSEDQAFKLERRAERNYAPAKQRHGGMQCCAKHQAKRSTR
jgi:hypothetical protein